MYRFAQKHRWFSSAQLMLVAISLLWNSAVSATAMLPFHPENQHETVLHSDPRTDWAHYVLTSEFTAEVEVETESDASSEQPVLPAYAFSASPVVGWTVPRRTASEPHLALAPRQGGSQSKLFLAFRVLRI